MSMISKPQVHEISTVDCSFSNTQAMDDINKYVYSFTKEKESQKKKETSTH